MPCILVDKHQHAVYFSMHMLHLITERSMYRYRLAVLFLCLGNTAYAETIENDKALRVIYDTRIAGIGLESSVEGIRNALSQHKIPMDCNYTEHTVVPKTKLGKKTKKKAFYQDWRCKYVDGTKYKMLDIHVVNGTIYSISYRGSILSSFDPKDIFSYYRGIDQKLLSTGIVHDGHDFVFREMGVDISPLYIEQRLMVKRLVSCHGASTMMIFEANVTEMIAQKAFTIKVKYERQRCI